MLNSIISNTQRLPTKPPKVNVYLHSIIICYLQDDYKVIKFYK